MSLSAHRVSTGQCTGKSRLVSPSECGGHRRKRSHGCIRPCLKSGAPCWSRSDRRGRTRESRPITIADLELAPPGADELQVRIEAAGVCHSDLSVVDGNRVRPTPMLLGHEAAGIVERVGDGVTDVAVGQRVVMTFLPRCGHCAACATDGLTPCEPGSAANNAGTLLGGGMRLSRGDGTVYHHLGVSGFATHAVVHRASVVPVPDDVPPPVAALLGCAVLTGGGAVLNVGKPQPGRRWPSSASAVSAWRR